MLDLDKVAIFWDYENCCPPATPGLGYDIANNIGRMARVFGCVTTFKAYLDISAQPAKATTLRSELQLSGVSIIDCPHNGKKEVVDKVVMVDMLAFALDNSPPATVFLITGDRDYAYAMSTLRLRDYKVILITPNTTACLEAQASAVVDWSVVLTRSRVESNSVSNIRRPYNDLDAKLFANLSREISQLGDDDMTVCSISPPSEGSSKSRQIDAEDLPRASFAKDDSIGKASNACECRHNQGPTEIPLKSFNISDDPPPSILSASKGPDSRRSSVSVPSLCRARSATVHSVTIPKSDKAPVQRLTGSLPAPSDVPFRVPSGAGTSTLPDSADRQIPDTGNDGLSDCDEPSTSVLIGSPAKPAPTNSFIHSPPPLLNPRLNLISTVPTPSSHTRTISGGIPVSLGDPRQKAFAAVKPAATPRLDQKVTPVPQLNPFSSDFIPNTDADLMEALGLSDDDHESINVCSTGGGSLPSRSDRASALYDNGLPKPVNSDSRVTTEESAANAVNTPNFVPPTKSPLLDEQGSPSVSSEGVQLVLEGSSYDGASTCTDQMSDLGSGFPALAVNATQSPSQPTADIRAGAPQNEAERQKIRTMFRPLIQRLLADRSTGISRPSRSEVAVAVLKLDKNAYKRAGVTTFKSYSQMAQAAGLVILGGTSANPWISLHPDWLDEAIEFGTSSRATEGNPSVADGKQSTFAGNVGAGCFQPLIDILMQFRRSNLQKALRSLVGQMLNPKVYQDAGVTDFEEYVTRAAEVHIVEVGGEGGRAWISLHPDVRI